METLKQMLHAKARHQGVLSIAPDARVYDALQVMAEKNIGALLVLEGGKLVGIITERDYARKVILKGKSSLDTPVREIMTDKVVCVRPEHTIEECMGLMTDKRIRHLPVLDSKKVVGVISIGDVVRAIIEDKEFDIQQLTKYISSG